MADEDGDAGKTVDQDRGTNACTTGDTDPGNDSEVAAVTSFWLALGLPGLIDVHTHFMPPNVLMKAWAFFESGDGGRGHPWPIAYRLPEAERLAVLRKFGVRRFGALRACPHWPWR
jgi:cytosine/adenosine deaminase-related metal-dependent hydrolase